MKWPHNIKFSYWRDMGPLSRLQYALKNLLWAMIEQFFYCLSVGNVTSYSREFSHYLLSWYRFAMSKIWEPIHLYLNSFNNITVKILLVLLKYLMCCTHNLFEHDLALQFSVVNICHIPLIGKNKFGDIAWLCWNNSKNPSTKSLV